MVIPDAVFNTIEAVNDLRLSIERFMNDLIFCYWNDELCVEINSCSDIKITDSSSMMVCENNGCKISDDLKRC